jgi:hypothetical protein
MGSLTSDHRSGHLVNDHDPPLIRLSIEAVGVGLHKVTATDSGAVLVDRTPNPLKAACAALRILGWGPAVLLQFTLPISTVKDL